MTGKYRMPDALRHADTPARAGPPAHHDGRQPDRPTQTRDMRTDEDGHSEGLTTGQTTFPASCPGLMSTTAFAASSFAERVRAAEK